MFIQSSGFLLGVVIWKETSWATQCCQGHRAEDTLGSTLRPPQCTLGVSSRLSGPRCQSGVALASGVGLGGAVFRQCRGQTDINQCARYPAPEPWTRGRGKCDPSQEYRGTLERGLRGTPGTRGPGQVSSQVSVPPFSPWTMSWLRLLPSPAQEEELETRLRQEGTWST